MSTGTAMSSRKRITAPILPTISNVLKYVMKMPQYWIQPKTSRFRMLLNTSAMLYATLASISQAKLRNSLTAHCLSTPQARARVVTRCA